MTAKEENNHIALLGSGKLVIHCLEDIGTSGITTCHSDDITRVRFVE